jgi:phospholipid-binding lipoprotein MlaA
MTHIFGGRFVPIAKTSQRLLALIALVLASGCATTSNPQDPLEGFNRGVSAFNSVTDKALIKPVALAYTKVVPQPVRTGVNNFFGNLGDVGVLVNNLLQGKFNNAASDFGRLSMNSTFGLFGLVDVASHLGIPKHNEDFGQTLAKWGVGSGPYLVLPIFGPSTVRDAFGAIPDNLLNPATYIDNEPARVSLAALGVVNARANLFKATNILEEAAIDQYVFTRDAWLQRRLGLVYDGDIPAHLQPQDDAEDPEDLEDPEPGGQPVPVPGAEKKEP